MNNSDSTQGGSVSSSLPDIQDAEDSISAQQSLSNDQSQQQQSQEPRPSTSRAGLHVSVQRSEISSTIVEEGCNELDKLNVEVYDQQTYENEVFEKVNKAISIADNVARTSNSRVQSNPNQFNDLMRLIHSQEDQDLLGDEPCDPTERDEQVLHLTRLERLKRTIKIERVTDPVYDLEPAALRILPRIPRSSKAIKTDSTTKTTPILDRPTTSQDGSLYHQPEVLSWTPRFGLLAKEADNNSNDTSGGGNSSASEYIPEAGDETSDNDAEENVEDDVDYETDDELGLSKSSDSDIEAKKSSRKYKNLSDDGDFKCYQARIKAYSKERAKIRLDNILDDGSELKKLDEMVSVEGALEMPKDVWDNLFEHQRTGVRWLWELHQLGTGGILGDEMGLGKTIQMIAFLTALKTSSVVDAHKGYRNLGPTVLVCPATVMHQWLLEFRKWWPPFRVAILHSTGTFSGDKKKLVEVINKSHGVLIVSYPGVIIYQDYLHGFDWHYAILDEGHKIRNPDAQVTLACKRFRTPHRVILSGSPVQNNLKELWSIFDYIYPGKLGTLPVFMEQFATPITQGGYANASDIQVQIAYKCTCVLRDTIKPFLLRRTKAEVNSKLKLPDRSEQVLFCKLTDKQRKLYQAFLDSPTIKDIKDGYCQIFVGLIQLRKICNHPDLFDSTECKRQVKPTQQAKDKRLLEFCSEDETYGHYKKSGKMMVVDALLKLWKKQNHKVLLFTQSRQMLKIFMNYLKERDYKYLVMDGTTAIGSRQTLIEEFNKNEEIFIFLLTTRVGGVGINLTGANRIIIYDPDWNPSTDIQARERAWRIGQQRHVIIYRLLTAGTIEEKIYHRQVFKLYLTNRVLKDAKQKRFFKTNDLHELFTLSDNDKNIETKALFDDDLQINAESIKRSKDQKKTKKRKRHGQHNGSISDESFTSDLAATNLIPEEKLRAMRERAKFLSRVIALQYGTSSRNQDSSQISIKVEPGLQAINGIPLEPVRVKREATTSSNVTNSPADDNAQAARNKRIRRENRKQRVDYLVRQDVYRPGGISEEPKSSYKHDDYILGRLFKSANISGALKHDKIETDSTADFKVVESEAEKVARDAIRILRESRRMCLDSSAGVSNWTGRNGQVAARRLIPKNKSRIQLNNALHSYNDRNDSLLSSIKRRNQANPVSLARGTFNAPSDSDDDERDKDFEGKANGTGADIMADKIREFLLFKSAATNEAQTDELLEFFKGNFTPDKTAIFKAILYKMCEFQRRGDKGFWVIRSEFRNI